MQVGIFSSLNVYLVLRYCTRTWNCYHQHVNLCNYLTGHLSKRCHWQVLVSLPGNRSKYCRPPLCNYNNMKRLPSCVWNVDTNLIISLTTWYMTFLFNLSTDAVCVWFIIVLWSSCLAIYMYCMSTKSLWRTKRLIGLSSWVDRRPVVGHTCLFRPWRYAPV